ncbi:MAG: hypothetical protein ABSB01_24930 [Streptosporangiaceae bacterium]|jgi:hypothetical protein
MSGQRTRDHVAGHAQDIGRRPLRRRPALTGQGLKLIMLPAGTWPATSLTA